MQFDGIIPGGTLAACRAGCEERLLADDDAAIGVADGLVARDAPPWAGCIKRSHVPQVVPCHAERLAYSVGDEGPPAVAVLGLLQPGGFVEIRIGIRVPAGVQVLQYIGGVV